MHSDLSHLQDLEAESIEIFRTVVAECANPVLLYSIGKDSSVLLHLARKAFYPAPLRFPLLHIDTKWKSQEITEFRDRIARDLGLALLVHTNPQALAQGVDPFEHGSARYFDMMKTQALKQALDMHGFTAAVAGTRRDEAGSHAANKIFSMHGPGRYSGPESEGPELWNVYNTQLTPGCSLRVFPLANWAEIDVWRYIERESIAVVPLYFAQRRPVVKRGGALIVVDDDRMQLRPGEVPEHRIVRFRTIGCYPLTPAVDSEARTVAEITLELAAEALSERQAYRIEPGYACGAQNEGGKGTSQ